MECPKHIQVENGDWSRFWVNIPNPKGNTPLQVCEYHYWNSMKDGVRKTWWGPLTWTPWGSNFGVRHGS